MIAAYKGIHPTIHPDAFIAPTAIIIGNVDIKQGASIWYGTVVRGDIEPITIGEDTNIQDNCTIHTEYDYPTTIGCNVSVGHNAVVHGCTVEDDCLIGIGAVVLNGAMIKKGCVVAAGSLVKEGQVLDPYQLVAGVPAVLKRQLDETTSQHFRQPAKNYLRHSTGHRDIEILQK